MFIKKFKNLSKNDTGIAGGKGASLGEMTQNGIPVPDGFVVLSKAFDDFLEKKDLNKKIKTILQTVNNQDISTVEKASTKIQSLILSSEIPKEIKKEIEEEFEKLDSSFVAVRSSATAEDSLSEAWAGQLESFLNTTEEKLLENVKKCWASLFTPRAVFYRFEKKLQNKNISVAVVVQKMIKSDVSGIAFSVHPVTEDQNQIIIEAGFGLGEAIVSGSITPDSYVVEKDNLAIIDINVSKQERKIIKDAKGGVKWENVSADEQEKQKLSEKQILKLSKLVLKIEDHYGLPQDIEWAMEKDEISIVQSRPITTLSTPEKIERDFITELKLNKLSLSIVYPFTPIIYFESGHKCYYDNPILDKFNIKKTPNFVSFQMDKYENWSDGNISFISDDKTIREIAKESLTVIKKNEKKAELMSKTDYSSLNNEKIAVILEEIDRILTEIYQVYILFIDEYFETNEPDLLKKLPDIRMQLSDFVERIQNVLRLILNEVKTRFKNIDSCAFDYATFEEINALLRNAEDENNFNAIKNRPIAFAGKRNVLNVLRGDEVLTLRKYLVEKSTDGNKNNIKEIKGRTVFCGLAKGRVKIVLEKDYGDFKNVLQGEDEFVLVTPMTRPEIVPYLKNCIAIITDEGGITCHAAIVSRELRIPCIVGTKIVTKILRDNDRIEVDANKGIVKILKKNE